MKIFLNTGYYATLEVLPEDERQKKLKKWEQQQKKSANRSWIDQFRTAIEKNNLDYIEVDIRREKERDRVGELYKNGDYFMGRFNEADFPKWASCYRQISPLFKENIFPNPLEVYYYNNKKRVAELIKEHGYPSPETIYLDSRPSLKHLPRRHALIKKYPLVRKTIRGAGSKGVSMVNSLDETGFPCILQKFIPNNEKDVRIIVVVSYALGFERLNRDNDFRASGSGKLIYPDDIPLDCMKIAYKISKENKFNCMGYDFLKDPNGKWLVSEFCYTFPGAGPGVEKCKFKFNAERKFKKETNNCSIQELLLKEMLLL
jgi:hypothetical protein